MATETCDPPDQPCILLVDDDADLMAFLFSVLTNEGFSIVAASHGQQALDLLEHGLRPHVIVIDLMLPRVSGIDVLHHIRTDQSLRTIPRIVITGASVDATIVADAVFRKPFDHNDLVAAIHRLAETVRPKTAESRVSPPAARDGARDAPRPEHWPRRGRS